MVQAYILVQTEVGKAADVAKEIAKIVGVTQAEDVTGPYDVIVRAEADNVDELGRLVASGIQSVEGITRTSRARSSTSSAAAGIRLRPAGPAALSACSPAARRSSAARAAVRGPSPSRAAARRSSGVSTSWRRPAMPGGSSSAAPPSPCQAPGLLPESRPERHARRRRVQGRTRPLPIGHERLRPQLRAAERRVQLGGLECGQVGGQRGQR